MAMKKYNRPEPAQGRLRRNRFLIVGVISIVLLCGLAGLVFARYMRSLQSGIAVRAKDFYFTSNLLDGEIHTLAPKTTGITFTLGNHEDELRYSEVDIEYTVTVKDNTGAAAGKIDPGSGTLKNGGESGNKGSDVSVTISDLVPGTYTVTATGKGGGYTKVLKTVIVVPDETKKLYWYLDKSASEYSLLTVWNEENNDEEVTITYTGIPDNTNPNMIGWETGGVDKTVQIGPHESKVFRFFGGVATASDATHKNLN